MLLYRCADSVSWINAALGELRETARMARLSNSGRMAVCLAGGTTPEPVYRAMAAHELSGVDVELWPGDERVVPLADPARNGTMIARAFENCVWNPYPRIKQWPEAQTESEALEAVEAYEAELAASLGHKPVFDLALLGLGADGHTASLFSVNETEGYRFTALGLTAVTRSPIAPFIRMTLSFAALGSTRRRVFLVRGPEKLGVVERLSLEDHRLPASRLAGPESIILYLEN